MKLEYFGVQSLMQIQDKLLTNGLHEAFDYHVGNESSNNHHNGNFVATDKHF